MLPRIIKLLKDGETQKVENLTWLNPAEFILSFAKHPDELLEAAWQSYNTDTIELVFTLIHASDERYRRTAKHLFLACQNKAMHDRKALATELLKSAAKYLMTIITKLEIDYRYLAMIYTQLVILSKEKYSTIVYLGSAIAARKKLQNKQDDDHIAICSQINMLLTSTSMLFDVTADHVTILFEGLPKHDFKKSILRNWFADSFSCITKIDAGDYELLPVCDQTGVVISVNILSTFYANCHSADPLHEQIFNLGRIAFNPAEKLSLFNFIAQYNFCYERVRQLPPSQTNYIIMDDMGALCALLTSSLKLGCMANKVIAAQFNAANYFTNCKKESLAPAFISSSQACIASLSKFIYKTHMRADNDALAEDSADISEHTDTPYVESTSKTMNKTLSTTPTSSQTKSSALLSRKRRELRP